MENLLNFIVREITGDGPVSISQSDVDGNTVFTITVAKAHMGTLIGKNGRMINAIRILARTKGAQENLRVNIELKEQE